MLIKLLLPIYRIHDFFLLFKLVDRKRISWRLYTLGVIELIEIEFFGLKNRGGMKIYIIWYIRNLCDLMVAFK
jgi:hypothetical protein